MDGGGAHEILQGNGSVQHVAAVPDAVKAVYKTAGEMKMRTLIDLAADRGAFVDQSQSLNLFVAEPTAAKLSSMHFYAWKAGLKTGMYYLRTRAAAEAIKVCAKGGEEPGLLGVNFFPLEMEHPCPAATARPARGGTGRPATPRPDRSGPAATDRPVSGVGPPQIYK